MKISLLCRGFPHDPKRSSDVVRVSLRHDDVVDLFDAIERFDEGRNADPRLREMILDFDKLRVYRDVPSDHPLMPALHSSDRLKRPVPVADSLFTGRLPVNILEQRVRLRSGQVCSLYASVDDSTGRLSRYSTLEIHYSDLFEYLLLVAPDDLLVDRFEDLVNSTPKVICDLLTGELEVVGAPPRPLPAGLRPEHLQPLLSSPDRVLRERGMAMLARFSEHERPLSSSRSRTPTL